MNATIYKADGSETPVTPANGKTFTLKEMQVAVGGYIQIETLLNGRLIIINEEGLMEGLPPNHAATIMAPHLLTGADGIVGDVLVCDPEMVS